MATNAFAELMRIMQAQQRGNTYDPIRGGSQFDPQAHLPVQMQGFLGGPLSEEEKGNQGPSAGFSPNDPRNPQVLAAYRAQSDANLRNQLGMAPLATAENVAQAKMQAELESRKRLQGLLSQGGDIDTASVGRALLPYDPKTGVDLLKAAREEQTQQALLQRTGGTGVAAQPGYRWNAQTGEQEFIPGSSADPAVQARLEAIKQGGKTGPGGTVAFEQENKLRDEFYKQAEPFVKIRDAHARVMASAQEPSGAGDLSLLYNYMKMLDPGSTVMAGEYAQAANAGGIPERIRAQYNKAISGEKLDPNMRADFVDRSNRLLKEQEKSFQNTSERYTKLTERYGLRPENVVGDLNIKQPSGTQANWQSQYQSKAQAVQGAMEAITRGVPRQVVIDRLREIGITDARI